MLKLPQEVKNKWLQEVKNEYKNLISNETFDLIENPNDQDTVILTTMIFKAKSRSDGQLDKLKARCCARGDLETEQDNYDNWSSCVSHRTVLTFIAHSTKHKRNPKQLDFIGAYLQANMQSRIYVTLQNDYKTHFPDLNKYFDRPLLLKKTLYGLTVSAKYWNEELVKWLRFNKFANLKQSTSDPSLFSYSDEKKWIRFIFYVDDVLYYGDSNETEKKFFEAISKAFKIECKGQAHWFLGMRIHRYQDGSHTIDQQLFTKTIIK